MRRLLFPFFTVLSLSVAAQPGTLDLSFNPGDVGNRIGEGANASVFAMVLKPDGRIVIGGQFDRYNGVVYSKLACLMPDGTADPGFAQPALNDQVFALALQPDGKLIAGGIFTTVGGVARNHVARLNEDGTLDTDFDPGTGFNGPVSCLAVQPDGRILAGGAFTSYNGQPCNRIVRLNADGTIDASFTPVSGADDGVGCMALQPDGAIVIGGSFTDYDGVPRNRVARLLPDGTLDTSFTIGTGANGTVYCLHVQPDGRIVVGGFFLYFNSTNHAWMVRLNVDGSIDNTYDPENLSYPRAFAAQPDGRLVITATTPLKVQRLLQDGADDPTFTSAQGADGPVNCLAIQPDGKVVVAGEFEGYDVFARGRVVRLNGDGTVDASFAPATGANGTLLDLAVQDDQRVLLSGWFTGYHGNRAFGIARALADGMHDPSFDTGWGFDAAAYEVLVRPDGHVLAGGSFTEYNGYSAMRLALLEPDGTFVTGYSPSIPNGIVHAIALQPDGKTLVGGSFTTVDGATHNRIVRLLVNGDVDTTFQTGTGVGGQSAVVYDMVLQIDGKAIIVGDFTNYDGFVTENIARLNTDGSVDNSFQPGVMLASASLREVALQPDGRILVGSTSSQYQGVVTGTLFRLNVDGSIDQSFQALPGPNGNVLDIALQPDGSVIAVGEFTVAGGQPRSRVVRFLSNGALDTGFDPGTGSNGQLEAVALQADGGVLIGGNMFSYDGVGRNRIARLIGSFGTAIPDRQQAGTLLAWPNPTDASCVLVTAQIHKGDPVRVFDMAGRSVMHATAREHGRFELDMQSWAPGAYWITIGTVSGGLRTRVVKE